jgi:CBS domain-containing protein
MQAREAMTTEVRTIAPDATVAEAAELMIESGHGAIPVVDADSRLLGVVTRFALVRRTLPSYLEEVGDLYLGPEPEASAAGTATAGAAAQPPRGEFEPFVEEVRELALLPVKDVMEPPLTVSEDTPLAEVAALMVTHHAHQAAVTKDGRLLGVLGLQDIIERIAWRQQR